MLPKARRLGSQQSRCTSKRLTHCKYFYPTDFNTRLKQNGSNSYATIEANGNTKSDIEPPSSWASQDVEPWLKTHATLVAERDIHVSHDLFDQEFDSLSATFLRHRIVGALKNSVHDAAKVAAQNIPQNFVYAHPSIEELTSAITKLIHSDADSNSGDGRKKALVEEMIAHYSVGLEEAIVQESSSTSSGGMVVLLTGSTGGLGSHILEILLSLASVERVYAFNRHGRIPVSGRQTAAFVDRALDVKLLSSEKLVYLEGDTTKSDLGLPPGVWKTVI